jgi:hypothetical protein
LISDTQDIWSLVFDNLLPDRRYAIYSVESYPPRGIKVPANVDALNINYPKSSIITQINSTWNVISKDPDFSYSDCVTDTFSLLINQDWQLLKDLFMISLTLTQGDRFISRYLPLYNFTIKSNNSNRHVKRAAKHYCYVWLMHESYENPYSLANARYLLKTNRRLSKFRVVDDIKSAVKKYYKAGFRNFILDAPSDFIKPVQKMKLHDSLFICNRSTDPTLRVPGSNFLFALCDDDTHIQDRGYAIKYATNDHYHYILGTSDNVNIPLYRDTLVKDGLKFLNVDELENVDPEVVVLMVVGNESDYNAVLDFVTANRSKYPRLLYILKNSALTTEEQQLRLDALSLGSNSIDVNYNSSEVFYDSEYAKISQPPYIGLKNFYFTLYLSNILFRLPLEYLYDFGLLIDV